MLFIEKIKRSLFPFYRSHKIKKIFRILNAENKKQAMFVGGCVRKFILNERIDDIDIATSLTPDEIIKRFENSNVKVIEHTVSSNNSKLFSNYVTEINCRVSSF